MLDEPKILVDRYPPLMKIFKNGNFSDRFEDLFWIAHHVHVATGYISALALAQMANDLERNAGSANFVLKSFDLVIGMHKFEGMTRPQKEAASALQNKLRTLRLGDVYIQQTFPFHGKLHGFTFDDNKTISIVGSSNFSALAKQTRQMEVDVEISGQQAIQVISFIKEMIDKTTKPYSPEEIKTLEMDNMFMNDLAGVKEVIPPEVDTINLWENALRYEIPLKTEAKSNLNPSFGRGRVQKKNQIELSRDWFEVELIVPKSTTDLDGYPRYAEFPVITDDGYAFNCNTGGAYSKNFRSAGSLKTLGRWIKGRMINAGAIEMGEIVKQSNLDRYGRRTITLLKNPDSDDWFLDFSVKEK